MHAFNINYYVGIDNVKLFSIVFNIIYGKYGMRVNNKCPKKKYSRKKCQKLRILAMKLFKIERKKS